MRTCKRVSNTDCYKYYAEDGSKTIRVICSWFSNQIVICIWILNQVFSYNACLQYHLCDALKERRSKLELDNLSITCHFMSDVVNIRLNPLMTANTKNLEGHTIDLYITIFL